MRPDVLLAQYGKRSDVVSFMITTGHIAFVLAPVYLAAVIGPGVLLVLFWLWTGLTMSGLLNLMHECAHYHVFKKRWGANLLGRWILAALMVTDFDAYRALHWAHHQNLGGSDDPKYSYKVDIRGWRLFLFFLRCLIGIEALKKFSYVVHTRPNANLSRSRFWIVRAMAFHLAFFASVFMVAWRFGVHDVRIAALNAAISYGAVYLYGVASLTLFAATLRAIAEHQNGTDHPEVVGNAVLRNLACGPIERLIFGCYGFAEHATHHLHPAIPSYHLRDATHELATEAPWLEPHVSYLAILTVQTHSKSPSEELQYLR
ncbi:MAG TPA: fatty acid desaturase [Terriglobales bacterium]|nr:fatty acid desaturase [Terriglobales bacterium]